MPRALPLILCLLIGIAIGWFMHPSPAPIAAEPDKRQGKRISTSRKGTDIRKFNLDQTGRDGGKSLDEINIENLSSADLLALIEEFQKLGDLADLTIEQRIKFGTAVVHSYKMVPRETLKWINGLENQKERADIITSLSEMETARDLDKAIALIRENLSPEDDYSLPFAMLQKAAEISEEKYLEISKLSITASSSYTSSSVNFPEGFAYRKVLNELARHEKEPAGKLPGVSSSNLMSNWTKVDPKAAYEWLQDNQSPSNYGMRDYINGLSAIRTSQELGIFLAADFDPQLTGNKRYQNIQEALTAKPNAQVLESFYSNAGGDKFTHAEEMLQNFSLWNSSRLAGLVLESLDPAERLQLVQSSKLDKNLEVEKFRNEIKEGLISLGHDDGEIKEALDR